MDEYGNSCDSLETHGKHVNLTTIENSIAVNSFVLFHPTKATKSNPMIKVTLEVSSKVNLGFGR